MYAGDTVLRVECCADRWKGPQKKECSMSSSGIFGKLSLLLAFALFMNVPSLAQDAKRPGVGIPDVEIDEPLLIFRSIERAWQAGNAQALSELASESRVFVEIRGVERRGGYFTRPQLFYIFKNMFASTNQLNFAFVKYHNLGKQDHRIYGMAQRSYRSNRRGGLYKDMVYVTLVKEGSRWAVAEIKSTW